MNVAKKARQRCPSRQVLAASGIGYLIADATIWATAGTEAVEAAAVAGRRWREGASSSSARDAVITHGGCHLFFHWTALLPISWRTSITSSSGSIGLPTLASRQKQVHEASVRAVLFGFRPRQSLDSAGVADLVHVAKRLAVQATLTRFVKDATLGGSRLRRPRDPEFLEARPPEGALTLLPSAPLVGARRSALDIAGAVEPVACKQMESQLAGIRADWCIPVLVNLTPQSAILAWARSAHDGRPTEELLQNQTLLFYAESINRCSRSTASELRAWHACATLSQRLPAGGDLAAEAAR